MKRDSEASGSPDFKILFESAPGLYLVLDPDLRIVAASNAYLDATMTVRENIAGRRIFEVFPDNPNDPAATGVSNLRVSLERVLQNGAPDAMAVQKYDVRRPESKGGEFEERFWSPLNSPVFGAGGEILYIIHRVEDVTAFVRLKQQGVLQHRFTEELQDRAGQMESEIFLRAQQVQQTNLKLEAANNELARLYEKSKEVERLRLQSFSERSKEALRASEQRYRQLFEVNPHPMWVYDLKTLAFLAVNEAAIEKYGYRREEFLQMTIDDIRSSDEQKIGNGSSSRHKRKDGTIIEVELTSHELPFKGRPAQLVAATDVTEKKRIETQLLRTQRMESIGTLAGGIAHDLNNVLAPILLAVQLLVDRTDDPSSKNLLETLQTSARRGAGIVRQLLTFARGTEGERVSIRMNHLLVGIEKMASGTFPKSIRIETKFPKGLWLVEGDPTQLDQVFLNLCVNARDAMPNGGTLKISAENTILDEHYARLNLESKAGKYLVVEVSDNGMGMAPGIVDKIFEPFFTTKEIGKGTGLGLSTVRAIVKSHDGFVNVYSELGKGTRFKVFLPARETAETGTAGLEQVPLPLGGSQLILVVDDESAVLDITKLILESHNYRVLTAKDGAMALACYARQSSEIHLVVLDMMMPIMDGPATIRTLEAINPNVKIIAASGLIDHAHLASMSSNNSNPVVRAVLSKPYTAEKLLRTLHEVLTTE